LGRHPWHHCSETPVTPPPQHQALLYLKQMVEALTRKQTVLEKIFTNIIHWYKEPMILGLPEIGHSGHQAIAMCPTASEAVKKGHCSKHRHKQKFTASPLTGWLHSIGCRCTE
jgi:hypothetical protein